MADSGYLTSLNRNIQTSGTPVEKGIAKICLEAYKNLPFSQKIKENFKKEIWKTKLNYLKYLIKDYFNK